MKLRDLFESLSQDKVLAIYKKNPKFFNNERYVKLGIEGGLFNFTLEMTPDEIDKFVDGNYSIGKWTDKNGVKYDKYLFETMFGDGMWDLWDCSSYDGDWEGALDYHINQENENKIQEIINKIILGNDEQLEDYTDHTLQDLINEFDDDYEIRNAITSALCSCEEDSYLKYLHKTLKQAVEEYGEVVKYKEYDDDAGISVKINMEEQIKSVYGKDFNKDENFIELMEDFNWDPKDAFRELVLDGWVDKPKFDTDDRWYPDIDDENFNEILDDRLDEIN